MSEPRRAPEDLHRYALGGVLPRTVAEPATIETLAQTLAECDRNGDAVVLFGGGTLQSLGALPARYDVAVDLGALAGVIAYDPRDLTIAAYAGTTLGQLQYELGRHGQFVPFDAPRAARATLGGTLAAGWLGPRRATYGNPREFVIGSTAVLADGTVASAGGMVVKNSTGYDMSKLYIGSLGTLGALARVNLKTLPLPQARRIALAPLPERTFRHTVANVRALALEPTVALVIRGFTSEIPGDDGLEGRVFLLFEGSSGTVDRATRDLRSALGGAGVPETQLIDRDVEGTFARLLDAYVAPLEDRAVTYRALGSAADAETRIAQFAQVAAAHELHVEWIADLRSGDAIARVGAADGEALATQIVPFDDALHDVLPAATVLQAPAHVRNRLAVWGAQPAAIATMRALKERFDPHGTLAPGRFVGGI